MENMHKSNSIYNNSGPSKKVSSKVTRKSSISIRVISINCCLCDFLLKNVNGHLVEKRAFHVCVSCGTAASNKRKSFSAGFLKALGMWMCKEELRNRRENSILT